MAQREEVINTLPEKFIGKAIAHGQDATVTDFCDTDIKVHVPSQHYTLDDLTGLIRFLKAHKKQLKATQRAAGLL